MNTRPPDVPSETRLIPLLAGLGFGFGIGVVAGFVLGHHIFG